MIMVMAELINYSLFNFFNFRTYHSFQDLQPSTQPPTITNTNYLQIPSPPILEQQIPQDPTTTATIFTSSITNCDQMPSSTSNSFEMPPFHSIFDLLMPKKPSQFDELSLMGSAPSSPPVLTRVDENPMECDDPNPPSLKPEISDHPEYGQNVSHVFWRLKSN